MLLGNFLVTKTEPNTTITKLRMLVLRKLDYDRVIGINETRGKLYGNEWELLQGPINRNALFDLFSL